MKPDDDKRSKQLAEVLRLHLTEGKGIKAIARRLKMHRRTVRKLLGVARGERKARPRRNRAPAVLDRLRAVGHQGGVTVVRDWLRLLRPRPKQEAFFTREYGPGQMLQVDWADCGFALPGCARRVSAFVAALAYSRHLYLEFVLSQAMGSFLRCMDRALRFFGGRTSVDVFDGMKTVVKEHAGNDVVFQSRFLEYASARGFSARRDELCRSCPLELARTGRLRWPSACAAGCRGPRCSRRSGPSQPRASRGVAQLGFERRESALHRGIAPQAGAGAPRASGRPSTSPRRRHWAGVIPDQRRKARRNARTEP